MTAALASFPDRNAAAFDLVVFNPAAPAEQRRQDLLRALPAPVRQALDGGTTVRRSRFADDGFDGVREEWTPPAGVSAAQAAAAARALEVLRRGPLAPASPDRLLARVLALLSHYPAKGLSPEVEQMVALDWAEDLGEFPAWAVDRAARIWRRTRKWRPSIAEMRELCRESCAGERALAERLARLAQAAPLEGASVGDNLRALAAGAVRRMA